MIHHSEVAATACSDDGPELGKLGLCGPERSVEALTHEDGARRPARLRSEKHRVSRKPRSLNPADGGDPTSDELMPIVHVQDQDHILPTGVEHISRATHTADSGSLIRLGRLSPASRTASRVRYADTINVQIKGQIRTTGDYPG